MWFGTGELAVNMLFWGRGSRTGSAMVPLDRALLTSYRLYTVTILLSVTVWPQFAMQILTRNSHPKSPLPVGDRGPCLMPCYCQPHECPCQVASHSVQRFSRMHTYIQTDRPRYGNICRNRQNPWMLLAMARKN